MVKCGIIATAHEGFVQVLQNTARRMTFLSHDRAARGHQKMCLDNQAVLHTSDMEFVTNGTCVKHFWARAGVSIFCKNLFFCKGRFQDFEFLAVQDSSIGDIVSQ